MNACKKGVRELMLDRNATSAFHDILCQGRDMSTMMDDITKSLFTAEALFILTLSYGLEVPIEIFKSAGWK